MEILDTIIRREIELIGNSSQNVIHFEWKCIVKANGKEVSALYVDQRKLDRLFMKNYADELRITATFVAGDYFDNILPYKNELEITMVKIPKNTLPSGDVDLTKNRVVATYRAQMVDGGSEVISGNNPLTITKSAAYQGAVKSINFQLFDMTIDRIRKISFGTNFCDTLPTDAIRYLLGEVTKTDLEDNATRIRGVDIADGFTDEIRKFIVLPDTTDILAAPHLINETVGGIYPTGFACYLQAGIWYVFPPFDCTRFTKQTPSLTLIKIPQHRMPSSEKTFRITPTQAVILTTRETVHRDLSESLQLNQGNAVTYADADKLMKEEYAARGGNKLVVNASQNVTAVANEKRRDGDMTVGADKLFTSNYNLEYSKLAYRSGSIIQTVWESANPEILRPGMPVRYIFADGATPREIYGVLVGVECLDYRNTINVGDQTFATIVLLTIFVSRQDPTQRPNLGAVTMTKTN